jgi:hypothetical protein
MKVNNLLTLLCITVIFISCKATNEKTEKKFEDVIYALQQKITDRTENDPAKETVWFVIKLYSGENENAFQSVIRYNKNNEQYEKLLDYYLNYASKDFSLEIGENQLKPISYWFENNHNIVGYDVINVGFDLAGIACNNCDGTISFNDRNFNNGIVKFSAKIKK